ncbi:MULTISPECIES: hypothetical protein [unclassified Aureimonas]|uniref:hypothetical protein n=1 Tax=unclassified Aureimonas TaxID=2615206 RepID=UPI000701B7AD|nr:MULTISPECIES: hypothetical protein [unclassified Aureimonas]KQT52255.1 hypothetical protein ASG62_16500 [Aureimonas sp. Leaf427]KQT65741.1 hypothetical protein ASG54_22560 [Aureimonas sp. Leaf460]
MTPCPNRQLIAQDSGRLSARAKRVAAKCKGGRVCKQYVPDERTGRGAFFFLEHGGAPLDAEGCEELIRKGMLRPAGDALFPDASSQTFEVAGA